MSSMPAVWKEIHHHLQCQSSHQASAMSTVKILQYQIHFLTQICLYRAISPGRPAEIRQEAGESSRRDSVSLDFYFQARQSNDQPGTATQGSRDSHELPRHCIEESRSLINNSVSDGPRHRTSTDTDQGPVNVQRDTDREWTSPDARKTKKGRQFF